jgi:hypothetical protein
MLLVSILLIQLPKEIGKNVREKGRRGRTGALLLVSMLLIPSVRR